MIDLQPELLKIIYSYIKCREYIVDLNKYIISSNNIKFIKKMYRKNIISSIELEYLLIDAARAGNLRLVKFLHKYGCNLTTNLCEGMRYAALQKHYKVVKYFHRNGVNLNICDNWLGLAVAINSDYHLYKYIKKNSSIEEYDIISLQYAINNNNIRMIKFLLRSNAGLHHLKFQLLKTTNNNKIKKILNSL